MDAPAASSSRFQKFIITASVVLGFLIVIALIVNSPAFSSPGSAENQQPSSVSPTQSELTNSKSPSVKPTESIKEAPNSVEKAPAGSTSKQPVTNNNQAPAPKAPAAPKVSPPDPTRPWLTQADIDANVAQRAALVGQFNQQLAVVQSLQAELNAKRREVFAACHPTNPPPSYDYTPCIQDGNVLIPAMEANLETELQELEQLNSQLQNGTWY